MSKQYLNLIETIENANSIIDISVKQIQNLILTDKSLLSLLTKMETKISGVEKKNFNIWLKYDSDSEFTLEISSKSENEIDIVYFKINQDLEISDYNYKYEFEDMNKLSNDLRDLMKTYFE